LTYEMDPWNENVRRDIVGRVVPCYFIIANN